MQTFGNISNTFAVQCTYVQGKNNKNKNYKNKSIYNRKFVFGNFALPTGKNYQQKYRSIYVFTYSEAVAIIHYIRSSVGLGRLLFWTGKKKKSFVHGIYKIRVF